MHSRTRSQSPAGATTTNGTDDSWEAFHPSLEPGEDTLIKAPSPIWVCLGMALFVLALLLVGASLTNSKKYQIKPTSNGIEIWRGKFAPMGNERMMVLPAGLLPSPQKPLYTKAEAYRLAYRYYNQQADALLSQGTLPDFNRIKTLLNQAKTFALSENQRQEVAKKLTHITLMTLLYKADVAASRGRTQDLKAALAYLKEAAALDVDRQTADQIHTKIAAITSTQHQ